MLVWQRILWLREQVKKQKAWIDRCGGNLQGYIANYGDPGTPPLDNDGKSKTITIPADKVHLFEGRLTSEGRLTPVEGVPNTFYAPHSGDGGTAIYNADYNRLRSYETQLSDLSISCGSARYVADEKAAQGCVVKEDGTVVEHQTTNPELRDMIRDGKFDELKEELLSRDQTESIGSALFAIAFMVEHNQIDGDGIRRLANHFFE